MTFGTPEDKPLPTLPGAPPPPPMFGQAPTGSKPQKKNMQPTVLGAGATPDAGVGNKGGKTLLGQ